MVPGLVGLIVVLIGVLGWQWWDARGESDVRHDISGSVTVYGSMQVSGTTGNMNCQGLGGFSDIGDGTQVTIKNGDNDVIATTELKSTNLSSPTDCMFLWEVPNVPEHDFYVISIANRGDLSFSLDDMIENSWRVSATLGN